MQGVIFSGLSQVSYFFLVIKESTNSTDVAQMSVNYFDIKFREELLSPVSLKGHTTSDVIYNKSEELLRLNSSSFERI